MTRDRELRQFAAELRAEAHQRLAGEPETIAGNMFVQTVAARLFEDGALESLDVCYLRQAGRPSLEISGYELSHNGTVLDLVTRQWDLDGGTVLKSQVDTLFRRAAAFAAACRDGLHRKLEEAAPAFDMAQRINAEWSQIQRIRIFLFTDGKTTLDRVEDGVVAGLPASYHIWDITRLHRLASSGRVQEEIVIDLEDMGQTVTVLKSPDQADGYHCLLAVLPGQLLADLYEKHHGRLLQRNVRAYLQARGKVNKAIHATVRQEPGRFLAYNNGISATATHVELDHDDPRGTVLKSIRDLQIVNGGQTTAALHHVRDTADLSDVYVMAKITVVPEERLDELVPMISRYANSQNVIRPADFEANGPFHIGLERVSRSVWAPPQGDSTRQTRWYYERARGQYQVERGRMKKAQRDTFDLEHPPTQRFEKTDAAKYEMAYLQLPHKVNLGAQKCFQEWTLDCKLDERAEPDIKYFHHLVAKGILFTQIRQHILDLKLGGYPGQTAAYVMALVVERLGGAMDLDLIWRLQDLPDALEAVIPRVTELVREIIIQPPGSANVTEWCKKEECWNRVRAVSWTAPTDLLALSAGR
ncbi:AIPR family protein [Longispora sp. K20-0274]|uniref:AIPR family protein n=1 Tax=Longispora sp. K20-0274 TaxID=3088255 RepID=UPI00399ABB5D